VKDEEVVKEMRRGQDKEGKESGRRMVGRRIVSLQGRWRKYGGRRERR
jgi:hypothetical protein